PFGGLAYVDDEQAGILLGRSGGVARTDLADARLGVGDEVLQRFRHGFAPFLSSRAVEQRGKRALRRSALPDTLLFSDTVETSSTVTAWPNTPSGSFATQRWL